MRLPGKNSGMSERGTSGLEKEGRPCGWGKQAVAITRTQDSRLFPKEEGDKPGFKFQLGAHGQVTSPSDWQCVLYKEKTLRPDPSHKFIKQMNLDWHREDL